MYLQLLNKNKQVKMSQTFINITQIRESNSAIFVHSILKHK